MIHFFCIVTEYWNFHLNTDTRSLTFCDHVNIKSQSNYYNYFYCCDFFLALQRELPLGLSLIRKVTQVDHDNVTSLRLDLPLQRELWWIAGLKVIRLHRTRGSLLMSLFSVPTNQAAPHKATSLPAGIKTDVQPGGSKRSSWGSLQLSYRTACSSSFQWISEYCTICTHGFLVHPHMTYSILQVIAPTLSLVILWCKSNYTLIYHETGAEGIKYEE